MNIITKVNHISGNIHSHVHTDTFIPSHIHAYSHMFTNSLMQGHKSMGSDAPTYLFICKHINILT